MKEIGQGGLQDKIIDSVKRQGGIARKLNGAFNKGIADLLIALPDYPLILGEAKYVGTKTGKALEYVVPLEPIQRNEMKAFNERNSNNFVALTGMHVLGDLLLFVTRDPKEAISMQYTPCSTYERGKGFDIVGLLWSTVYGYARIRNA